MLRRLHITRFKSIRNLTLDLGRVNLFIGGNGTGKSNILEAVGLVSACLGRGLGDTDIGSKGLRITPPELMKSSFKNEDLPRTLEFSAFFDGDVSYKVALTSRENDPLLRFFSESCEVDGKKIFGRSYRGARATGIPFADRLDRGRGIWDQVRSYYDIPTPVAEEFDKFSRYMIYSPQTDFLRGRQVGRVDVPPVGLRGEGLPEAVLSLVQAWNEAKSREESPKKRKKGAEDNDWKILDSSLDLVWLPGWAEQVHVDKLDAFLTSRDVADRSGKMVYFVDRFMHAKRNKLSVYDSSEGTLFLLFASILLAHRDAPRIFALDNVDNALNPRLTRKLVEQIINVSKLSSTSSSALGAEQVFLTSHNPTSLDAFDLFDDNCRVFVVQRDEKGRTAVERLQPALGMSREDWEIAKGGRNLSQLWLDGEINGALGGI